MNGPFARGAEGDEQATAWCVLPCVLRGLARMPEVPWPVALLLIFTGLQRRERSFGPENDSIHLPEDLVETTDSQFRFDTSCCYTNRLRGRSF
jgi:hypothetical protein